MAKVKVVVHDTTTCVVPTKPMDSVHVNAIGPTVAVIPEHESLRGRDKPNQHPISAISGLSDALENLKIRHGTTEHWQSDITFIPKKGQIIIYEDYSQIEKEGEMINVPAFKIGDGLAFLVDLPFVNDDLRMELINHINDINMHVSLNDRLSWNNKVTCYTEEQPELDGETLIFSKD